MMTKIIETTKSHEHQQQDLEQLKAILNRSKYPNGKTD